MILVDYSAVSMGSFVSGHIGNDEPLLRHVILNNLRSYNHKYSEKYGEMVLCMDHRSWRKDVFEHYKYSRKQSRDESKIDWEAGFETLNKIAQEIKDNLPYRVIHLRGAEGDDGIATLVKRCQQFGKWEPCMIIAADKDYVQLQKYEGVKQWSTNTKKLVKGNPRDWLIDSIAKGQKKDGVPNVKSPSDFFTIEGGRQKSITKKFLERLKSEDIESVLTEEEYTRWKENEILLSFDHIPENIEKQIIDAYENYEIPEFKGLLNYLIKSRCSGLIDTIQQFKPREYNA